MLPEAPAASDSLREDDILLGRSWTLVRFGAFPREFPFDNLFPGGLECVLFHYLNKV
jgi:hypothetical protein